MTWSAVYVLAGLVLTLWLVRLWIRRRPSGERASRPRELANAELVYMEELFRIREPIRLVAKVDRVYRLPGGALVLVELKTRRQDRPYLTDIIQLSAQRLAIEVQTGAVVEPYAFVSVLGRNRKTRSHQVRLFDATEVVELYRQREAILTSRAPPAYASTESACRSCALRSRCDRFVDQRLASGRSAVPHDQGRVLDMSTTSTRIEDAGSPQLGSFSSIASHRRWVTSWVGKAIHDTNIAAKLLICKQEIPGAERYDIVLL